MTLQLKLIAAAVILALLGGALLGYGKHQRDIGRAEVQLKWDAAVAKQIAEALVQSEENRKREAQILENQRKAEDEAVKQINIARSDAERARIAAGNANAALARLRNNANAAPPSQAGADPAPAGNCTDANQTVTVLADVLGQLIDRARTIAAFADETHAASQACVSAYGSLK